MKKVLLISDTHGDETSLSKILKIENDIDIKIHCGDFMLKKEYMNNNFNYWVYGNNDFSDTSNNQELIINIEGMSFLLLHGHTKGISAFTPKKELSLLAESLNVDGIIFGHIHIPLFEKVKNKYIINPGSHVQPRNPEGATYTILEIEDKKIKHICKYV